VAHWSLEGSGGLAFFMDGIGWNSHDEMGLESCHLISSVLNRIGYWTLNLKETVEASVSRDENPKDA
jgi:hypothetical protein